MTRNRLFYVGSVPVYEESESKTVFFAAGMTIDDDGDPQAYGPSGKGRDYLANAGHAGNWWAVVTDAHGRPIVQKIDDPAPGFYVSTTSLQDKTKRHQDPKRYVNAWHIPFVAIPGPLFEYVRLGDLGTAVYRNVIQHFIVADTGGRGHIGEGSPALARALKIDPDPKKGGLDTKAVGYMIYPNSGTGLPMKRAEIETRTEQIMLLRGIKIDQFFDTRQSIKRHHKLTRRITIRR